ncbi:MAG: response regulator [Gemmatimonadetes bacterium]|nr:response regulator [Gemmatimonadota bacterium]
MSSRFHDATLTHEVRRLHRFAIAALGVIALIAVSGVIVVESKARSLLHARQVLRVLNEAERGVERVVNDGDRRAGNSTATRGDTARGDTHAVLALFDSLAELTADNPAQRARVATARDAAVARLEAAARRRENTAVVMAPDAPERLRLAETIRAVRDVEQQLYDDRTAGQRAWRYTMLTLILASLALVAYALRRFQRTTLDGATDAAEARADLDEAQQRLAFVLERAPLAVAIVREDGLAEVRNPRWDDLVDDESLAVGASSHPVATILARLVARVRANDRLEVEELVIGDGGGAQVWTATAYPLDSAGAGVRRVGVILADISAHRALEERLRHSQRLEAIGRLAGGVAHDFNNILTAILGFTEIVHARIGDEDEGRVREDLLQVTRAAERAALLTRQLLTFSRQQVLHPRALDLGEVVRSLEPMLRRLIGSHIVLHVETARDLWAVYADRGQMEQVIVNLALNARDAMPHGGELVISTSHLHTDDGTRGVALTVADTGVGIAAADQARIFEPFFTTKAAGQGTGLGLATVQAIVQQVQGTIGVESSEGQGTRFIITLPPHDGPVEEAAPTPTPRPASRSASLLVVDDDRDVRQLMEYALTEAGYTVVTFGNGQDALAWLQRATRVPDLVITDLVMPGVGGEELAAQIAADGRPIPLLYISGYAQEQHNALTRAPGDAPILRKPFTASQLLAEVATRLEAGAAQA